jgi:hypothetical protein
VFDNRRPPSELDVRQRRELDWWQLFGLKFGPKNLPRPGDQLSERPYRLQEQLDDGSWRDVVAR